MAVKDGDGWIQCQCGNKHWGVHGAAGLLLVRDQQILLQHRAPWVHNGDTWGIPGGARDSHEEILEAAIREALEECGIQAEHITALHTYTDDHQEWAYHTVIAQANEKLEAQHVNDEALQVAWVKYEDVTRMNLHPSFARSWPALLAVIGELGI